MVHDKHGYYHPPPQHLELVFEDSHCTSSENMLKNCIQQGKLISQPNTGTSLYLPLHLHLHYPTLWLGSIGVLMGLQAALLVSWSKSVDLNAKLMPDQGDPFSNPILGCFCLNLEMQIELDACINDQPLIIVIKKQNVVARSSAKAEYGAIIWILLH
ncbi:hypothetical protein CR513_28190, partial [Mucuna pruriens]